jgi:hypothetical protein
MSHFTAIETFAIRQLEDLGSPLTEAQFITFFPYYKDRDYTTSI